MLDTLTPFNMTQDGRIDYWTIPEDNKFQPFDFELSDWSDWRSWASYCYSHWYIAPIVGVFYVWGIFALKRFMKNRQPYNLKTELFLWNASIGIFSIMGFLRTAPELIHILSQKEGFYNSMCSIVSSKPSMFWTLLFCLSKYVELGDTVFICLRKKPLVVLQWYHHLVTMVGTWIAFPFLEPVNRYVIVINFGVHSLMYPYFALRALNIKIPRVLANIITTLQFSQMLVDMFVQGYSAYLFYYKSSCYRHPTAMMYTLFVLVTFIYLFGNLFHKSVILKGKNKQSNTEKQQNRLKTQ